MTDGKPARSRRGKTIGRWRLDELKLLLSAGVCVIWAFLLSHVYVLKQRSLDVRDYLVPALFLSTCLAAHLLLSILKTHADQTVLPAMTFLGGFGLAFQYRLGLSGIEWQSGLMTVIWIAAPLITALIALALQWMGLTWMRSLSRVSWAVVYGLPLVVLIGGNAFRGATFGPGMTTPTEFVKPLVVIGLAALLTTHGKHLNSKKGFFGFESIRAHLTVLVIWSIPQLLFLAQRDLGMIVIQFLILLIMMTAVTGRVRYLLTGVSGMILAGWSAVHFVSRVRVRLDAWLTPFEHPDGSGYQIMHALFAVFNGEFLGRGFGGGVPNVIPLVRTDFVYASVAEEIGLPGSAALIGIFMYLAARSCRIAAGQREPFAALIAIGCGALIWIQTLLNIGGVIKLIPMTGVPLPFISQGGSAALSFSIVFGLLLGVSAISRR